MSSSKINSIKYWRKVEQHVCARCSKPLMEDYKLILCRDCLDKKSSSARQLRAFRKVQGLCIDCGNESLPGQVRCATCRDKRNKSKREAYKRKCIEKILQSRTLNSSDGTT